MFGRGSNGVQPAGQDASETPEDGDLGRSDDNGEDRIPEFEEDQMAGCRAMGAASPRHEGGRQEVCLGDIVGIMAGQYFRPIFCQYSANIAHNGKILGGAFLPQTPLIKYFGGGSELNLKVEVPH
ncbi:hypothetical protein C8F04DRAFT_1233241 [Mycena alexandri]|uniref:Uncharacterized protein n=1 Tax=Mycena alexandri TaxID=1745969 RepID=A0AAD6X2B3_9AGAR|nr:hypothetical protein C8F04DRAFT_1233241 [Mycena alexandri]